MPWHVPYIIAGKHTVRKLRTCTFKPHGFSIMYNRCRRAIPHAAILGGYVFMQAAAGASHQAYSTAGPSSSSSSAGAAGGSPTVVAATSSPQYAPEDTYDVIVVGAGHAGETFADNTLNNTLK